MKTETRPTDAVVGPGHDYFWTASIRRAVAVIASVIALAAGGSSTVRSSLPVPVQPNQAPAWTVSYGREFWRQPSAAPEATSNDESGGESMLSTIDPGDVVDRVSHALSATPDASFATVRAKRYVATFAPQGLRLVSHSASASEHDPCAAIRFRTRSIRREANALYVAGVSTPEWSVVGNTAQALLNEPCGIVEHFETRREGVAVTWVFECALPGAGPLWIDADLAGMIHAGETVAGHQFADPTGSARLRFGKVTAVDSAGHRWDIPVRADLADGGTVRVEVPADVVEQASYPLAIDPLLSPEFEVGGTCAPGGEMPGEQSQPAVAFDGSQYLVVWEDNRLWELTGIDIYGARVDPSGVIIEPCGLLICAANGSQRVPAVAGNSGRFLVVWEDERNATEFSGVVPDIYGAFVGPGGVSTDFDVSGRIQFIPGEGEVLQPAPGPQRAPAVAAHGTEFLVVWENSDSGPFIPSAGVDVYGVRVTRTPSVLRPGVRISAGAGDELAPAVAANGTGYLVVWEDTRGPASSGHDIYGALVDPTGAVSPEQVLSTEIVLNLRDPRPAVQDQSLPAVASNGTEYFVAWRDARDSRAPLVFESIYGTRVGTAGTAIDRGNIRLSSSIFSDHPAVAANACSYVVLWDEAPGGAGANRVIRGTQVDPAGFVVSPGGFGLNSQQTDETSPAVVAGGPGRFLIVSEAVRNGAQRVEASFLTTPARCGSRIPGLSNPGVDNNGVLLVDGLVDPHYRLTQSADPNLPGPEAVVVNPGWPVGPAGPWLANGPNSKWIAPLASQATGNRPGDYSYELSFDLNGLDPATAMIVGQWGADDAAVDVRLNHVSQGAPGTVGFGSWTPFEILSGFKPGVNTLTFRIRNGGDAINPTGLRVELDGVALPAPAPSGCLDFQSLPVGAQPNPWTYGGASFFGVNSDGSALAALNVSTSSSGFTGLSQFYGLTIEWANPACDSMVMVLLGPARVATVDSAGRILEVVTTGGSHQTPQTLRFRGKDVARITIEDTSAEAWLLSLCCVEGDCLDFAAMPLGVQPNPWIQGGWSFGGFDFRGDPLPNLAIHTLSSATASFTGLSFGRELDITNVAFFCDSIEVTLVSVAAQAEVSTYDSAGAVLETQTMSVPWGTIETLRLRGQNVAKLVIRAPSEETLLLKLCCRTAECSLTVTTTADSGPGSLRAAIECANNRPGLDTISFAIPGAGPHTIRPLTSLPAVTDPAIVNGYTQPGAVPNSRVVGNDAQLRIEIDGSSIPSTSTGLVLRANNSVVRGLAVNGFDDGGIGIALLGRSNVVEGSFVGTDTSGSSARPNSHAIVIEQASDNRIGGSDPGSRNVISGNVYSGVWIQGASAAGNQVQGNYIGTDASGLKPLSNGTSDGNGAGVAISGGAFNRIGGANPGEGNVISANRQSNVIVVGTSNIIEGNLIGPDATRAGFLGSGYYGVLVWQSSVGNIVGGTQAGAGNVIAGNPRGINVGAGASDTVIAGNSILFNAIDGVALEPGSAHTRVGGTDRAAANRIAFNRRRGVGVFGASEGNRILGNSIHDNDRLGIDLTLVSLANEESDGPTANDARDPDTGPNGLQNYPVLQSAHLAGGDVIIQGTLKSRPGTAYRLEFFANTAPDPTGYGEGEVCLGSIEVTTDAAGNAPFAVALPALGDRLHYTATATDAAGNTSEFSPAIGLTGAAALPCLWNTGVDSTGTALADDALDPHYVLVQGSPVVGAPFVARGGYPIPPWVEGDASSAWIGPTVSTQGPGATEGSAVYRYETVFDLTGFDPNSVVISGRWPSDNRGVDILINGRSTGQANPAQFGDWTPFHLRSGFTAGLNRLTFLVSNGEGEVTPDGPTGLRVEMQGAGATAQRLSIARRGNQVVVSWQGAGSVLQSADSVTGPWTDLGPGTSRDGVTFEVIVPASGGMKFYRLRLERPCATAVARLDARSTIPVNGDFDGGMARFLSFKVPAPSTANASERALTFLSEFAELFGLVNPAGQFRVRRVVEDELGSHVFLTQHQRDIEVLAAEIAVHLTADAVVGFNGAYLPLLPEALAPSIDAASASAAAMAGADPEAAAAIQGAPELALFNASLLMTSSELVLRGLDAATHLVWQVGVVQHDGRHASHVVDATTGVVLLRIPLDKEHAAAMDLQISSAQNGTENSAACTFLSPVVVWFDEAGASAGATPPPDQEGTAAFNLVREVYDFYFDNFHRHSWNGKEIQVTSILDVGNWRRNAAFVPNCNYFVYGDGMVTRDIVAHEFTHGVTQTSAELVYLNQSGALNESYSDVMGAMVDTANWTIGEGSAAGILRDMENPPRFTACDPNAPADCLAHPDHMDDLRLITWDAGGVHVNSGIPNRAAVLIAAGGTHRGMTVRGLGRAKTQQLYYKVLTTRLTQNSQFMAARSATVQQARDWAAAGLHGFTADDVCEVARAFAAVGLTSAETVDTLPPELIQIRAVYQRVSDNLETGAEIIPSTGFVRANIARDRRIVLAVTAADNESGVESITLSGEISWDCTDPNTASASHHAGTLAILSDEVRDGTAVPGQPLVRTAHFTLDPFENRPHRLLCGLAEHSSAVGLTLFVNVENGSGCVTDPTRSAAITFFYLPRLADCPGLPSPLAGDGTDNVVVTVTRDGLPEDQVGLSLTVDPSITWWKAVNLAGFEAWTQDDVRASRITVPLSAVVANPVLELKKAKVAGAHTGVQTLTLPTPAAFGGCTISLNWTRDQ